MVVLEKVADVNPMAPQKLLAEQREIPTHRIDVLPERKEGGIPRRKRRLDPSQVGQVHVVIQSQRLQDLVGGQVRQHPVRDERVRVPFGKLLPGKTVERSEQSSGKLVDPQDRGLRLIVRDGP